ncbi:MAG TPA: cytochrome c biogenesis protein CcdA [Candidatus Acidoferrales bacterium]|nr:cytochrome c biogenesis protein CcdA [Candidatus Acidoferrales bacterium]
MSVALALVSAFAAGLASSIGPCIAPRYLILSAYLTERRQGVHALAFVAGCLGGYLVYAFAGALIGLLRVGTHVVYASLALALIVCGGRALMSAEHEACKPARPASLSLGGVFLAGLVSSAIFSPCCTPIAIALGLQASQDGGATAASLLLAFGLGHTLPLGLALIAASSRLRFKWFSISRDASATISGSLLLMVGGLYAILA